ncbi:MAG: hypothetical protein ABJH05_09190 [Fulvivirga sp.]
MESNYLKYLITEDVYVITESSADSPLQENVKTDVDTNVDSNAVSEPTPAPYIEKIPVKGNNSSAILILNFDENAAFVADENLTFLKNILSAVKLDIDQVALVNLAKVDLAIDAIIKELKPKTIIGFGVNHIEQLKPHTIYKISTHQNCQTLLADDLKLIESDKSKKKALWEGLQELFLR